MQLARGSCRGARGGGRPTPSTPPPSPGTGLYHSIANSLQYRSSLYPFTFVIIDCGLSFNDDYAYLQISDTMARNVAVIGAGPSGLCCVRHLSERPNDFNVVCFEKSSNIGGMWVYSNNTGLDDEGQPVHSSLYRNLK